jgi:hypothetical protein
MDLSAFKHGTRFYDSQKGLFCTVRHQLKPSYSTSTWEYSSTSTASTTLSGPTNVYLVYDIPSDRRGRIPIGTFLGTWGRGGLIPHGKKNFDHLMETHSR